jgi:alkylation response protein AidB-like acyl-CoA dehydrogenase
MTTPVKAPENERVDQFRISRINSVEKSFQTVESSREAWEHQSFLKNIFMGKFDYSLISPFPKGKAFSASFINFRSEFQEFLQTVDSDLIDREGKIPSNVLTKLKALRAFALKIGLEYGGHGFTQSEYNEILKLTASKDANLTALLSAHQSIGVPQPLIMFGTEAQKKKYLTRISEGEISAFALTEKNVGSDPANLETTIEEKDDVYILNGQKLWCTNGTIADVIVVMARDEEDDSISALIVEMNWEGVKVEHRCHFMGLKALENAVISFTNVKVPKENLIGEKGKGLKLALMTLNTGRLSLPAAIAGQTKKYLEIARYWCRDRVQWGKPLYQHEAIAEKLTNLASTAFACNAVSDMATALYDQKSDIRLEAAVAKLFCSEKGWVAVDELLQMRGGRGYETADSLKNRGEANIPVERYLRDFRINRIFEGTSEIMHLFIAREAIDEHVQLTKILMAKDSSLWLKMKSLPQIFAFYLLWYPTLWFTRDFYSRSKTAILKRLSKRLARSMFHSMVIHGPGLQNKQLLLSRHVDIGMYIFAMAVTNARAEDLTRKGISNANDLSEIFFDTTKSDVESLFKKIKKNTDTKHYKIAKKIELDQYLWLEEGIIPMTKEQKEKMSHMRDHFH